MERIYTVKVEWTGNLGNGTVKYDGYSRNHTIIGKDKPEILASSEVYFRGDDSRYNPEELLVSALSTCHMLWYLHLCADAGIIVQTYTDSPEGKMLIPDIGPGHFTSVLLKPIVQITDASMVGRALELHNYAKKSCFIANSVNFTVDHLPEIQIIR